MVLTALLMSPPVEATGAGEVLAAGALADEELSSVAATIAPPATPASTAVRLSATTPAPSRRPRRGWEWDWGGGQDGIGGRLTRRWSLGGQFRRRRHRRGTHRRGTRRRPARGRRRGLLPVGRAVNRPRPALVLRGR